MNRLLAIILLGFVTAAHGAQIVVRGPVRAPSQITYLIDENFEGTGTPGGWTVDAGSPNFDYTTTVLSGAQSLSFLSTEETHVDFTAQAECWVKFEVRGTGTVDNSYAINLQDSSSTQLARVMLIASSGTVRLYHGATNSQSVGALAQDTTATIWIRCTKGTGANSSASLYLAAGTGGVKGSALISITGQNVTTDASRLRVLAVGAQRIIVDKVQVAATEIP